MGRTANKQTPNTDNAISEDVAEKKGQAAQELVAIEQQQAALVRATAAKLGYMLPADATDPDLIQRDIAANMRRSVEACIEVGRGLTVLKAACPHGQFASRLDVLGIDGSVARRFIQAAMKFSNRALTHDLTKAIGNQTKLFEMLILDDEQIEELAELGQTGELTLDDVATMSVKELRSALRDERQERQAGDKVREDLSKKLTKLQVESRKKVAADTDWPDALEPLAEQIAAAGRKMATAISELETCRLTIWQVGQEIPEENEVERAKFEAAIAHLATLEGQALQKAQADLEKELQVYDQTLGNMLPTE
jgi:hypothetical protein